MLGNNQTYVGPAINTFDGAVHLIVNDSGYGERGSTTLLQQKWHIEGVSMGAHTANDIIDKERTDGAIAAVGYAGKFFCRLPYHPEACRGGDDSVLSTQQYMEQVVEDVGEDEDFNSGSWVGATEYVKANGGISCSPNALGDLKVTVKDLSGGSAMLMEEEEIVKLVEKEEMADLELHVYRNVIYQEDLYKFNEETLDLVLEEEARVSRAHEVWLEKYRQQKEDDAEHKRRLLGFHGTI
nr:hypothetical protein [Tanacetum cinerariifolium]